MKEEYFKENQDICCIIVFYKPTDIQVHHANEIARFANVIVVDNSDIPLDAAKLAFDYYPLCSNKGIAFAQNFAISKAKEKKSEFILFLDQDSVINEDFILKMVAQYNDIYTIDKKIAALGPVIINKKDGQRYKDYLKDKAFGIVDTIISSGTLVKTDIFPYVGMMEERLFIDVVDHEWCWRCRQKGYNVYMSSSVQMLHEVGTKTIRVLGVQFLLSSPFRYFYKFRNSLWMMRRNYVPNKWKIKRLIELFLHLLLFFSWSIFGSRKDFFRYSIKGIKAAFN